MVEQFEKTVLHAQSEMNGDNTNSLVNLIVIIGSSLGFILNHAPSVSWLNGPDGRWLETIRQWMSRGLGIIFHKRAGPRSVTGEEYAGTLNLSLDEVEDYLWEGGFKRNLLSRLKTRNGEIEVGSWVYRESPLSKRQLHLMLFPGPNGCVDVYAHDEFSSVNPLVSRDHFPGTDQQAREGVKQVRDRFPLHAEGTVFHR